LQFQDKLQDKTMNPSVNCSLGKTGNGTNLMNIAFKKVPVFMHQQDGIYKTAQTGKGCMYFKEHTFSFFLNRLN